MFAKNYIIHSKEFQPFSDILNQDYETTKNYKIYVNEHSAATSLCYTKREIIPTTDKGQEIPAFSTIEVEADSGDHVYLKVTNTPVNIEISEV